MKTWQINNALHCPGILTAIIRNIRRQQRFIKKYLQNELAAARLSNDGTLDDSDFKKITNYYGLAVPAILGEALCVLRGKKMSMQERMACTYQGAFTGLFDDFFDKHDATDESLRAFIEKPESITPTNSSETLFLQFFNKSRQYFNNEALTMRYFRNVYDAQVISRKQAGSGLPEKEIRDITINKGGVSVLFYRSVFATPLDNAEEQALYHMGGLMQFGNDIFDVYKDSLQGISTLVTTAARINDVRTLFRQMAVDSFQAFYALGYPRRNVKKFLRLISMSLCSRCYVCLDQLERTESRTNGRFSPTLCTREELVCDMDKWANKRRSIGYFIKATF